MNGVSVNAETTENVIHMETDSMNITRQQNAAGVATHQDHRQAPLPPVPKTPGSTSPAPPQPSTEGMQPMEVDATALPVPLANDDANFDATVQEIAQIVADMSRSGEPRNFGAPLPRSRTLFKS